MQRLWHCISEEEESHLYNSREDKSNPAIQQDVRKGEALVNCTLRNKHFQDMMAYEFVCKMYNKNICIKSKSE